MRYQGRINEWKDQRGFGFIAPNGGGAKVYLHISSMTHHQRRPAVGDLVTYELSTDHKGRPQAITASLIRDRRQFHPLRASSFLAVAVGALALAFVVYVAYVRISNPNSTVKASVYKIFWARAALHSNPQFQCEPSKSSCTHMRSCAEAFFHQERCGVRGMDGDGDGIPCERQWCN